MKEKKVPMRMCVGCRQMYPKKELIRVVHGMDGAVAIDATGRKNGRGAYICRKAECLKNALKTRQLERTFSCALDEAVKAELVKTMETLEGQETADGQS